MALLLVGISLLVMSCSCWEASPTCGGATTDNVTGVDIENIQYCSTGGGMCLSWTTTIPAVCKVSYCLGSQCFTTDLEPKMQVSHLIAIPAGSKEITIYATGEDESYVEAVISN